MAERSESSSDRAGTDATKTGEKLSAEEQKKLRMLRMWKIREQMGLAMQNWQQNPSSGSCMFHSDSDGNVYMDFDLDPVAMAFLSSTQGLVDEDDPATDKRGGDEQREPKE